MKNIKELKETMNIKEIKDICIKCLKETVMKVLGVSLYYHVLQCSICKTIYIKNRFDNSREILHKP